MAIWVDFPVLLATVQLTLEEGDEILSVKQG